MKEVILIGGFALAVYLLSTGFQKKQPVNGSNGSTGGNGKGASGEKYVMHSQLLSVGNQGADVRTLQTILTNLGYNPGTVDGIFGELTRQAVQRFQSTHNIAADGMVGQETYTVLARELEKQGDTLKHPFN